MSISKINEIVDRLEEDMVGFLIDMCSIPAVNPSFGGSGEFPRAQWLRAFLVSHDIPVEVVAVNDSAVPEGKRLNLIGRLSGAEKGKVLWVAGHMDTVAPGDVSAWETDPLVPVRKDGRIYGRGVEDNGQAIATMIYAAIALGKLGIKPRHDIGLLFVSDEEAGNAKGLKYLVQHGYFKPEDEAIIPDAGSSDGSLVEVAEKSMLWCRFTVMGQETHASRPHMGINAGWVGTLFAAELIQSLRSKYRDRDLIFDPPYSTFELTQKLSNVESPNVISGKDVFATDFRVLPNWKLDDIINDIKRMSTKYEYEYNVKILCELTQRVDAPVPTPADADIVTNLASALKERGVYPRIGGIGGGTCAAMLREIGIPAVVWSTIDEMAHKPNEYAIIKNLTADTKTLLSIMLS